jgi:hypothetical protein
MNKDFRAVDQPIRRQYASLQIIKKRVHAGKAVTAISARLAAPRRPVVRPKLLFMIAKRSQLLPEVEDLGSRKRRRSQPPLESTSSETISGAPYA